MILYNVKWKSQKGINLDHSKNIITIHHTLGYLYKIIMSVLTL